MARIERLGAYGDVGRRAVHARSGRCGFAPSWKRGLQLPTLGYGFPACFWRVAAARLSISSAAAVRFVAFRRPPNAYTPCNGARRIRHQPACCLKPLPNIGNASSYLMMVEACSSEITPSLFHRLSIGVPAAHFRIASAHDGRRIELTRVAYSRKIAAIRL